MTTIHVTPALSLLAASRENLANAAEKADAAHKAHSQLLVRKSEAEAASAAALTDFRTGKITEDVAGIRKAAADADAKDIQALIDQSVPLLAAINEEFSHTKTRAAEAEKAARREELQLTADELNKQIKHLEATLLSAVGEIVRVHGEMNPPRDLSQRSVSNSRFAVSTYGIYKPCDALENLVRQNVLPRA